jgi:hypothetical protein
MFRKFGTNRQLGGFPTFYLQLVFKRFVYINFWLAMTGGTRGTEKHTRAKARVLLGGGVCSATEDGCRSMKRLCLVFAFFTVSVSCFTECVHAVQEILVALVSMCRASQTTCVVANIVLIAALGHIII